MEEACVNYFIYSWQSNAMNERDLAFVESKYKGMHEKNSKRPIILVIQKPKSKFASTIQATTFW